MRKIIIICMLICPMQSIFGQTTNLKTSVEPLLKTTWGQDAPYHSMCPTRTNSKGEQQHCRVGCVACAMGQIMYYHQHPKTGKGQKSYTFIVSASADFGSTHYDWGNMLENYTATHSPQQDTAVATLLYHCGVSVSMIYGLTASYTNTFNTVSNALKEYFRYDGQSVRYVKRSDFPSKEEWLQMIYENLSEGLPVFYSGSSKSLGAHAFVIDGYDEEGKVHINWGWYGQRNGYYDIDLNEAGVDFNEQQSMVIGIKPAADDTGISPVELSTSTAENPNYTIYSIDGRKIAETAQKPFLNKGLYIINGKKIVIK